MLVNADISKLEFLISIKYDRMFEKLSEFQKTFIGFV